MSFGLHSLAPNEGANVRKKRLGRGHGTGRHKTSGKGMKGQRARTGHHGLPKPGFEGGQTAMARRLPKRGFNSLNREEISIVNLADIVRVFQGVSVVEPKNLIDAGLVPGNATTIKILAKSAGEALPKMTLRAHKFSEAAKRLLTDAGCTVEVLVSKAKATPR